MYQVVEMTDEEKFEMYMKVPHEELVRMKIEEERVLKMLEQDREQYHCHCFNCVHRRPYGMLAYDMYK